MPLEMPPRSKKGASEYIKLSKSECQPLVSYVASPYLYAVLELVPVYAVAYFVLNPFTLANDEPLDNELLPL